MTDAAAARIFLTGASAGIGEALATAYAGPGVTLGLVARRADRLGALAEKLKATGCRVIPYTADVTDAAEMKRTALAFCEAAGGVDLAIANAGIGLSDKLADGDASGLAEMFRVNVVGVANTLLPLIPKMMAQRSGHIVTIGSVAGFRGLPGKAGYSATKSAVKTLMDGYRSSLAPHGIRVTTICPGFVESELTARNKYPMPFIIPAAKAAGLIRRAVARDAKTYIFPWQMRLLVPLFSLVPDRLMSSYKN
jgi:NADP-dependent 3-hydroxy acid dehydrogenase YdfG